MNDGDGARARLDEERRRLEEVRESIDTMSDESERESLSELSSADQHQAGSAWCRRWRCLTSCNSLDKSVLIREIRGSHFFR